MDNYYNEELLSEISQSELIRFQQFIETYPLKNISWNNKVIPYCLCGNGNRTILTFAGGWGGPELLYNTVLYFEKKCKILIVDVSFFDNPEDLKKAVNQILRIERITQVMPFGQSFSGVIAQIYLIKNLERVSKIILANTFALKNTKSKGWVLFIIHIFPFALMKSMLISKLNKGVDFEKSVPSNVLERIRFSRSMMVQYIKLKLTKRMIMNILKNIIISLKLYKLPIQEFESWNGRTLLISSEDELYYSDTQLFQKNFPNTELFLLPTGYKHFSPAVHNEIFYKKILSFIGSEQ